jgi:polyketide biosynthesis 3-hydroxy-3-methylglutaryl-CoA synthase-like enzyme PksG
MTGVGIEDLSVYAGVAAIDVAELFRGRGLDLGRMGNIGQEQRSIGLGFEDPVTSAVNAARPIVARLAPQQRERIEVLITSTESGLDYSKSIASYVHDYLGLGRHCRLLEVKQACYAATGALQLSVGYLASGMSPGAKVLVIATDVALVDARAEYAEPSTGFGAAAVLLGDDPRVLRMDVGAFGTYSYETLDSARPTARTDIVDVDRSLFAYLDCLANTVEDYCARVDGADFARSFHQLAMHTPFAGIVKAGHRKLMRDRGVRDAGEITADFDRRLAASLVYPKRIGNLCSGTVYLALLSLLENAVVPPPLRVGLYSYGSGCSAEFFSGVIPAGAAAAVAAPGLGARLDDRTMIDFATYESLLAANLAVLDPVADRDIDFAPGKPLVPPGAGPLLALRQVRGYHRAYEWI